MAANSKPFYIINRKVKKNKLLYVRFLNRDGNLGAPLSVTALAHKIGYPKTEKITKKREAERVCAIALERGLVKTIKLKQTFIDFVKDYWDYDGKRVQRKIRLKPNSIGKSHCYTMATLFTLHAVPYLPENADISEITRRDLQHVLNKLVDNTKLANSSIHKVMMSMTVPLHYAYQNDLILSDPTKNLDPIDQRGKEKGILTPSEFKAVISWMEINSPPHVLLATILAAGTGMRMGEVRALRTDDISIVNELDAIIRIDESYTDLDKFKPPKSRRTRLTPCPRKLADALLALAAQNPNGGNLVFWAVKCGGPNTPIAPNYIHDGLYKAFHTALKMDEEERKRRNITFHSLRHYFITRAGSMNGINRDTLRLTVGHESVAMTEHYTHADYESMKAIAEASRHILE
ncbi:MAG: tyrosine-type recombinase/integrase [Sphaerochaeta sp.]|nr:tyrosine-type recombinase/integrase [Sphaerochaeta sp.]